MQTIVANAPLILGVLFALSEALSLIPGIAANGVFQAVFSALKFLKEKVAPAALPKA